MILKTEYHHFYQPYLNQVDLNSTIIDNLQDSLNAVFNLLGNLPEEKINYRYAPNKWSIKQLVQHIIDTERVFSYRALAISRKDKTNLPGFDENEYVANTNNNTNFTDLLKEFSLLRKSNIAMFKNFTPEILEQTGNANDAKISVRAIGYIMSGHVLHHLQIIEERYL